ncbi:hypothetical protein PCE1_002726 [Barthelona sp. PCE]
MLFCPICGSMVIVDASSRISLYCPDCPFTNQIEEQIIENKVTPRKVEEVVTDNFDSYDKTREECPECSHHSAFYFTLQIRSADEPSTIFYQCEGCQHRWRSD